MSQSTAVFSRDFVIAVVKENADEEVVEVQTAYNFYLL